MVLEHRVSSARNDLHLDHARCLDDHVIQRVSQAAPRRHRRWRPYPRGSNSDRMAARIPNVLPCGHPRRWPAPRGRGAAW